VIEFDQVGTRRNVFDSSRCTGLLKCLRGHFLLRLEFVLNILERRAYMPRKT
jgi:hypothetical protein